MFRRIGLVLMSVRALSRANPNTRQLSADPCGSGLARESSGSVNLNVCWADVFAAMRRSDKPAMLLILRQLQAAGRLVQGPQMFTHLLEIGLAGGNFRSPRRLQQRPHLFIQVAGQRLQLLLARCAF